MPYRKFNLAVGELPPVLNDRCKTGGRRLVDNFAGFAASGIKGQREYLTLLFAGNAACQIMGTNEHVGTRKGVNADGREYPTLEAQPWSIGSGFFPRCPPSQQSINGVGKPPGIAG
jgi:hypothetical protein